MPIYPEKPSTSGSGAADWSTITNKPVFSTVSFSGSYLDLSNLPTLFDGQWSSITGKPTFASVSTTGSYNDLSNKPDLSVYATTSALSAYATTSSLANYVTSSSLTSTLSNYVTSSAISSTLASYVTSSSLSTTLNGYVTSSSLTTTLGNYATTASLSNYATTASLSGYVSNSALTSALTAYVTSSSLSMTLGSYVSSSSLSTTLGGYATATALTSGLATKFATPTGTTSQYIRGDGSLATMPTLFDGTYASLTGKPTFATVATTGSYADLINKPTIVNLVVATPVAKTPNALATAYQATTNTKPTLITVNITSTSSISLTGTSNNEGAIYVGSTTGVATGTGTKIGEYKNSLGGGLVVGLTITAAQTQPYSFILPAGWYWAAVQSVGTGMSIVSAFEQSLI